MTAREVLDELEKWSRDGWNLGDMDGANVHVMWIKKLRAMREQIEAEASAWDHPAPTVPNDANVILTPAARAAIAERLRAELDAEPDDTADWTDAEPSALEVALRLVESGKVAAVPRQAAAFACDLIDCIRARQAKEVGR